MRAYSTDLRQRVVVASDQATESREQIARRLSVSVPWIGKLLRQRRDTGSIEPPPHGGGQRPALDADGLERLGKAIADQPDATPAELREAIGAGCSIAAVHRASVKLDQTYRKSRSTPPSRIGPSGRPGARRGARSSPGWTRPGWCPSTRPAPRPT